MMTIFCQVADDDVICRVWEQDVPDEGPARYMPVAREGTRYEVLAEWFNTHTPPTPTSEPRFNGGTPAWVEISPLEILRTRKKDEINAAHEIANVTSFTFMGKEIQANAHSMNQIQITNGGVLLRGALHPNWQGAWKTLDNEFVLIPDVATWKAFYDAIETTGQSNFAKAQSLKAQLASATTPEQVAAITWSAA